MKTRYNMTVISTLLMSLCLLTFIPGSLRFASTWRDPYFETPCLREQNLLMPLGFYSLALMMIGLIILWTGYRKKERWAWFVMLIILFFYVFPLSVLQPLLVVLPQPWSWSGWFQALREGFEPAVWTAEGFVTFLVMLVALLLPIKEFFLDVG